VVVLSLDVFETCLIRDVGQQEGVWQIVCRRLRDMREDVPTDVAFAELRGLTEQTVRQASQKEDVPLAEVYQELGASLGWTTDFCTIAAEVECQVEFDVARANPRALELVGREAPEGIWYLSDTVLPASLIGRMLRSEGFPDGSVTTSGDEGVRKTTGSLFRTMARREGVRHRNIRHVGNDLRVDGGGSARSGVRFAHVPEANYNRYEQNLDSLSSRASGLLGSCLAAASRRCRLELSDEVDPGLLSVECSVAGPTIFSCAAWALKSAEADGIRHLYFVARDGQILLRAALIIQERLGIAPDVKCHYLYGSRLAWHLASSFIGGWEQATQVLLYAEAGQSLRSMLRSFQLSEDELQSVADSILPTGPSLDEQLGKSSGAVIGQLLQSSILRSLWVEHATIAYRNTTHYLRQEGMLADEPVGLVDIGWLGKAAGALATVAEAEGTSIRCYFAGGLVGADSTSAPPGSRAYLVHALGIDLPDRLGLIYLLETFCSGTEGSTLGYEEVAGTYRPTLNAPTNDIALRWGLAPYQGAVARFVAAACENLRIAGEELDIAALGAIRFPIRRNIAVLWNDPDGPEVRAWGSFPFEMSSGRVVGLASLPRLGSIGKYLWDPTGDREAVGLGPWLAADSMLIVSPFGGEKLFRTSRKAYRRIRSGLAPRGLGLLGLVNHRLSSGGQGGAS
jgi:hypothetical protein